MQSKKYLLTTTVMLILATALFSCKKDTSDQSQGVTQEEAIVMSEENANADAEYDDVAEIGMSVGADLETADTDESAQPSSTEGQAGVRLDVFVDLKFKTGSCTNLDISPRGNVYPKTVTIDYGDGCICRDGKFRKGKIILVFSAPMRKPGAVVTTTLHSYSVNKVSIEGTKTFSNLSANGTVKYAAKIEGGKVTYPNGRGFSFEATKTVRLTAGADTRSIRDDVYEIEGSNKTVYANGRTVVRTTLVPLTRKVSCSWLVKGEVKVVINERVFFIDFGSAGECDNKAILKWANGQLYFTLL